MRATEATWEKIRQEYVSGEGTVKQVAARWGVPWASATTRAQRENWVSAKQERAANVMSALIAGPGAAAQLQPPAVITVSGPGWLEERGAEYREAGGILLARGRGLIQESESAEDGSERALLARAGAALIDAARECLGIPKMGNLRPQQGKIKSSISDIQVD